MRSEPPIFPSVVVHLKPLLPGRYVNYPLCRKQGDRLHTDEALVSINMKGEEKMKIIALEEHFQTAEIYAGLNPAVSASLATAGWGWHMETGIHAQGRKAGRA